MVNVYEMNDFSEWVAAESEQQAQDFYKELTGEVSTDDPDYPFALPESSMEREKFKDVDGTYGEKNKVYTFREILQRRLASGERAPFYFACSNE